MANRRVINRGGCGTKVVDPPTVDSIATEGKEGIVKGEAFAAVGANLSWHEGDKVTVKWTEDGEEKSLEIEPTETSPTKMDFDAVGAFDDIPDDTELTFEFELSGQSVEGETRILGEQGKLKGRRCLTAYARRGRKAM